MEATLSLFVQAVLVVRGKLLWGMHRKCVLHCSREADAMVKC